MAHAPVCRDCSSSRVLKRLACGLTFLALASAGGAAGQPAAKASRLSLDPLPKSIVFDATFSADGKLLAVACFDKTVTVYDTATGGQRALLRGHTERVWSVAFAPDGRSLVSGSGEYRRPDEPGQVKLWDLVTGKERASLSGHKGLVFAVAYSPDGRTVASASWDGTVKLWDPATGKERLTLEGHAGPVRAVAYSPDGKVLATGSFDGTVRLWDAANPKDPRVIQAHAVGVQCLKFASSGRVFATSDRPTSPDTKHEFKFWELATGKELGRFEGLINRVLSVDFSPDGRMLAVGGGDLTRSGEVKLVEACSGGVRAELKAHKEWVESVRFSPDGRILVSGGGFTMEAPGELHVWHLADLREAKPLKAEVSPQEQQALWEALADPDAAKAYQAALSLRDIPGPAVGLLKERLRPATPADPQRLTRLIVALDDLSFQVRQRAAAELADLGDAARETLQKAVTDAPSEEARNRARELLKRLEIPISSPVLLRQLRAVEILEQIGTAEAKALVDELTKGAAGARLTDAARETTERWRTR